MEQKEGYMCVIATIVALVWGWWVFSDIVLIKGK